MAPAPESARARPLALRRAPLVRFTLLSCITVVQICYTVVMVTNSSSTKKKGLFVVQPESLEPGGVTL